MRKRLLTIDDLVKFCEQRSFNYFNASDEGYSVSVQVPSVYEIVEDTDNNKRGLMKLKIKVLHTGKNRNGSYVSEESAIAAMPSIKNRPVMAHIHQLDNGEWDFEGHNLEITKDENGNEKITYIEKQVGSFSEEDSFFEEDAETGKKYVCAYAYIPEEYTKAAEILRRKNGTKNSCELFVDEFSYDAKEKQLNLKAFYVSASTLLGSRDDGTEIGEGMVGSRADIVDFSSDNNSVISLNDQMIKQMNQINENISKLVDYTVKNAEKGGVKMSKFEELLAKYEKTVEDVTFDYENMTDEELEKAFAEVFDNGEDNTGDNTGAEPDTDNVDNTDNSDGDKTISQYSISFANGDTITFGVSLNETIEAMYTLVNEIYSETDGTYYSVTVYDDYVVMSDYWSSTNYKQSYTKDGNEFVLTGERTQVYANYLTKDEEEQLKELRDNYSKVTEKLSKYEEAELNSQKEAVFADEAYSKYLETDEFKNLMENKSKYSLDELKNECELAFSKCVRKLGFSLNTEETAQPKDTTQKVTRKTFASKEDKEKKNHYGTLKFD